MAQHRKLPKGERLTRDAGDPTPAQIRKQAELIRRRWTPAELARRGQIKTPNWAPPICSTELLSDYIYDADAGSFN